MTCQSHIHYFSCKLYLMNQYPCSNTLHGQSWLIILILITQKSAFIHRQKLIELVKCICLGIRKIQSVAQWFFYDCNWQLLVVSNVDVVILFWNEWWIARIRKIIMYDLASFLRIYGAFKHLFIVRREVCLYGQIESKWFDLDL